MAGRGPAPKEASTRTRRNKDVVPTRVLASAVAPQPDLPDIQIEEDGELVGYSWPSITRDWWRMWRESPLSSEFSAADWSFLMETALLHAKYWRGDTSLAGELRLRQAKFGVTPEDRLRLRITFEQADEAADKGRERRERASRSIDPKDDPRNALKAG